MADDTPIPGASVYRRSRSKNLWISYRLPSGKRVRKSAGTDDEDVAWRILEKEYRSSSELTFVEAVTEFFTVHGRTLKPKTLQGYQTSLRTLDPYFGKTTLARITINDLKKFVSARRQEVSDASVRRDLMFLSSVFSYAQEAIPGAPGVNPVIQLPKKRLKENKRDKFLTYEEFLRLERSCQLEWQKLVVRTAVYTGMRHSEVLHLRKDQINFDRREIQLERERTKNQKPRIIPILPELLDTLASWCDWSHGDWVFCHYSQQKKALVPYTSFAGFFKSARVRAGLEDLRFHDLRHTFASWWMQEGGISMC